MSLLVLSARLWKTERGGVSSVMKFVIIIEQAANNYSAYVPDLPGCVATGATEAEVTELLRETIQMHMDGLREDGESIPEPTTSTAYVTV
jgi:predicted RNase H-like HicB family nuclease